MFLDALGLVSNAQALAASAVCTDKVDLGAVTPRRRIQDGEPVGFGLVVDVAADFTTGDETYQINVVTDEDAALGSPTVLSSTVLTAAQLVAGARFFLPFPVGVALERYVGLTYTLAGTTPTVTVTAWLTAQSTFDKLMIYAKGYTIS